MEGQTPFGQLTPEESEKAQEWLRVHWKNWKCPFSGDEDWEIGAFLAQAPSYRPANQTYPLLVVTCKGCGYVAFINAIWAGIVQPGRRPWER